MVVTGEINPRTSWILY